jgi:cyclic-di-GMP-binding protein
MLTLPLEPTDDRADPLFKDAAGCTEWLKQFQLTNLQRAHNLLLTQVNELNRYPMRGLERLNTLERLRETIHHVQNDYAKKLVAKPLPLNESELLVFIAIVQLWQTLVSGYQRCLQDYIAEDSQLAGHGTLLCQRCLLYSGLAIFEHLRTGYEFDAKLWQQLHRLYAFTEQRGLHLEEIPEPLNNAPHQTRSSCHSIYIKTLLACYARPAELTRSQLQLLGSWLAQWSSTVSLERSYTSSKGDAQPLALDMDSTHGLRPVTLVTHSGSMRYLATVPLSKLLRVKTIFLQQGKTPQQLELGNYSSADCIEFLTFLHQCWCENRNMRSDERNQVSKRVHLCYKPESIHAQLSGNKGGETGLPVETWLLQNESVLGAQLACEGTPIGRLGHNQLVALRFGDAKTFMLGTTAWANVTRAGQLCIGVRYLPGKVCAIGIRTVDLSVNPAPAFLLQAAPALKTPPSLIVPRDWFKAGRMVDIQHQNGEKQHAIMGFSVERGIDFERVSFTLV